MKAMTDNEIKKQKSLFIKAEIAEEDKLEIELIIRRQKREKNGK